jgi:hypothetical protein
MKLNGEEITMDCFFVDIANLDGCADDMENSLHKIKKAILESNMKTNNEIAKVPYCGREKTVADQFLKGERLDQVDFFTYLGRTTSRNGRSTSKIKC